MTESHNSEGIDSAPTLPENKNIQERFWGKVTVLEEGPRYRINHIVIKPNHTMTTQIHYHRSEHWVVVSGTARVICGEKELLLTPNQSTYVPPCTPHRVENPGMIPLQIIEVQNGEYLGEDDTIRLQKNQTRATEEVSSQNAGT
ncbi:MAG: phosphomannose isomerase type II C-terminal cupin domain [Oscillatoriaceae bacterium SKW80]|nr:phosphomannose isomerase type II C-terminal cupin domain [Oscillatoriaceae bacterium SKYG93]MCX8121481.1 phosphomannose isomerase type II C-terminal cupin domain [Oscillatoriaceae bacterium SKW80]MDW8452933.1 phosphomannose isomerase type II C-terminal cupin domain [Oscillatoriaceae cyanobacterium SKYGB_i_bin93]HIK27827.1 phosphomannose isomerase type II C-terminal cupin domain [Oscillatoriaceae cyanobacterium M7585_C2015_266]